MVLRDFEDCVLALRWELELKLKLRLGLGLGKLGLDDETDEIDEAALLPVELIDEQGLPLRA